MPLVQKFQTIVEVKKLFLLVSSEQPLAIVTSDKNIHRSNRTCIYFPEAGPKIIAVRGKEGEEAIGTANIINCTHLHLMPNEKLRGKWNKNVAIKKNNEIKG
jgi:hypothetical protein